MNLTIGVEREMGEKEWKERTVDLAVVYSAGLADSSCHCERIRQ